MLKLNTVYRFQHRLAIVLRAGETCDIVFITTGYCDFEKNFTLYKEDESMYSEDLGHLLEFDQVFIRRLFDART